MQVFHLSHTDLDGYGCQYIANKVFDNITFFNSNYGKEVTTRLQHICTKIDSQLAQGDISSTLSLLESKFRAKIDKSSDKHSKKDSATPTHSNDAKSTKSNQKEFLILITDLNLTLSEAKWLNDKITSYQAN